MAWAVLTFRKLKKYANGGIPGRNVGQIYSENDKETSLVLHTVVRMKVVSWSGFPRKAEPEPSDFREQ